MKKKFLKKLISIIMCMTLVSTQIFAETEKESNLAHSTDIHSSHYLSYIDNNFHDHDHDYDSAKYDGNNDVFNQEKIIVNSQKGMLTDNVDIIKVNQDKSSNPQVSFLQNNILSTNVLEDNIFEYELFFAAQLMKKDVADISYSSIIYDLDSRPLYYLVEFSSGGYAIILRTHSIPIEMSYTSKDSPYSKNNGVKKYYSGMLSYATESNGQIISLHTNKPIVQKDISASKQACAIMLNNIYSDYKQKNMQASSLRQSDIQALYKQGTFSIRAQNSDSIVEISNASYFSNDAPFGYNEDGDCGPTAAAMLMRYYDDNVNSNIIDKRSIHVDDIWRDELKSYSSTGKVTGTVPWDEEDKINVYFGENKPNLYYIARYFLLSTDVAESLISQNKPIAFYGNLIVPNYDNHVVLAYGYQNIFINSKITMFKIHNGYHDDCQNYVGYKTCNGGKRDDLWLNQYLLGGVLWLEEIPSSHVHDFTYSSDSTNHQQVCSCGLKKKIGVHNEILIVNETSHAKVCGTCNYILSECRLQNFEDATCTKPKKCYNCNESFGTPLGHSFGTATCTSPAKCIRCDVTTGTALGHSYRSATCITPKICIRCDISSGTPLGHDYSDATCTTAPKCTRCGATTGTSLGHNYSSATCITASKCTRCGTTTGTALGHSYSAATCTTASKCSRCGTTTGTALGHSYSAATCTSPKKCSRCGVTTGTALGHVWSYGVCNYKFCDMCGTSSGSTTHNWVSGTCTYKSCSKCGSSSGTSIHSYNAATCMLPKTCRNCGATSGTKLGHNFVNGKCTRCPISINRIKDYE